MSAVENWSDANWPYTPQEIDRIRQLLLKNQQQAIVRVVEAGKLYALNSEFPRANKKPNPRREIANLNSAITDLRKALSAVSSEAEKHLQSRYRQGDAHEGTMHCKDLWHALIRFTVENGKGLSDPAAAPKPGAIARTVERSWMEKTRAVFELSRGANATRGWPGFLTACAEPLQKRHKLPTIELKSWQDKRRKNSTIKVPN